MKGSPSVACLVLLALMTASCRQVAEVVAPKSINPAVVQQAALPGCWYSYMPERAPGFCLCTNTALVWHDLEMDIGYWSGLHPRAPHRVLMEAKGSTFILHKRYIWDGCSVGETLPRDLMPSLRHDALYHALKEGATFSRRQADLAFLRDQRRAGVGGAWFNYLCLRLFGGVFNRPGEEKTLLVQPQEKEETP